MTPRQIELARHALGLPNRHKKSYRNRFVASPGHADYEDWMQIRAEKCATRRIYTESENHWFLLTRKGALSVLFDGETLCEEDFPADDPLKYVAQARDTISDPAVWVGNGSFAMISEGKFSLLTALYVAVCEDIGWPSWNLGACPPVTEDDLVKLSVFRKQEMNLCKLKRVDILPHFENKKTTNHQHVINFLDHVLG